MQTMRKGSAGTNFLIKALMNGDMGNYIRIGVNGTWGNARVKTQLVDMFEEEDQTFVADDIWGTARKTSVPNSSLLATPKKLG